MSCHVYDCNCLEKRISGLEKQLAERTVTQNARLEETERSLYLRISDLEKKLAEAHGHIKHALLTFCQGACPVCGDDYPEDPLANGCDGCIWVHESQRLLDAAEAKP